MRTPRLPVVDWTDAPHRFKWTRPFRRKTKSGFCACAITFQTQSTIPLILWACWIRLTDWPGASTLVLLRPIPFHCAVPLKQKKRVRKVKIITCRPLGKFFMLIMAAVPSTLILYLELCSFHNVRTGFVWVRRVWNGSADPKSRPVRGAFRHKILNAKGERPAEIHKQIVAVYGNVMNRQNVTKWCREFSERSSTTMMRCKKKSWRGSKGRRQTSMTRGYRSWFQDLTNVWTMPANMLKNKVIRGLEL